MPNELGDSLFSPKSLLGERRVIRAGGRALVGLGAARLPTPLKLRIPALIQRGSRTAGDEFRRREGNNPDPRLRSSSQAQWKTRWACWDSQEVGSEAAIL